MNLKIFIPPLQAVVFCAKAQAKKATLCVTFSVLAPPAQLEPTTLCNNTSALHCATGQMDKFAVAYANGKHCRQPSYGLMAPNLRSHWSDSRGRNKNKSMVYDHALVFGFIVQKCNSEIIT